ncbi:MAG: hypothetical protein IKB56_00380 [Clostridia bacterium]|nr:hypothetical protein [Clostridia bacterium]
MAKMKGSLKIALMIMAFALLFVAFSFLPKGNSFAEEKRVIKIYLDSVCLEKDEAINGIKLLRFSDGTSLKEGHYLYIVTVRNDADGTMYFAKTIFGNVIEIKNEKGKIVTYEYEIIIDEEKNGEAHRFTTLCDETCEYCDYERKSNYLHRAGHTAHYNYVDSYLHTYNCECGKEITEQHYEYEDDSSCKHCGNFVALGLAGKLGVWGNDAVVYEKPLSAWNEYEKVYGSYYVSANISHDRDGDGKITVQDLSYNGEIIKEVVDFKEIEPKVYSFTLVGYNFTTENCTLYTNIGDFSMNCTPSMSENLVRLSEKIWPLYVFVGFAVVVIVIIVVTVAKSKNNKNSVK